MHLWHRGGGDESAIIPVELLNFLEIHLNNAIAFQNCWDFNLLNITIQTRNRQGDYVVHSWYARFLPFIVKCRLSS